MSDAESLIIYITTLCAAALLIHLGHKHRNRAVEVILVGGGIILPTLLGGLRYMVGADFNSYTAKMNLAPSMGMLEFSDMFSIEPSVWLLGRLSHTLFGSGILFFFVTSFLLTLFFYLGLRRFGTKHVGLAMLLILLVIFPQALSGVRQGVAMAMSFYAMSFIPSKKLFHFVAITLLAGILFHVTALALLVIYPLYNWVVRPPIGGKEFLRRLAIVLTALIALLPVGLFVIQYIPFFDKFANYYGVFIEMFAHLAGTHNILPELFALVFVVVFFKSIIVKSEIGRFGFMMTTLMCIMTGLGLMMPLAGRFADFFMPVFLMIFPSVIDVFSNKRLKILATIAIIGWALAFFVGAFYIKGSGTIFPYQFIF